MNGNRQAALTVNGEEISFQEFQQAYDRAYQRLSDQFGGNVPKELVESLGIKQQVINQLIQTALLRQGAKEMGIQVSGEEIRLAIENMVQFQDNGAFDMDKYKSVLSANRMAPTKFEKSMRTDRLSQIAVRDISGFANVATDFEVDEIYKRLNEKVAVKYVKFTPQSFEEEVTIDDDTLKSWFETVKEDYKTAPRLKLKYLTFTFEEIGNKIEIDQDRIATYYNDNKDQFNVAEKRQARHILLKATEDESEEIHAQKKKQAESVLQLARNGEDFSELAKEYSDGPSKSVGGELGSFPAGRMVPPFDSAVFSMNEGEISDIVTTRFGYHIILLEKIEPASTRSLEEVTEHIRKTMQAKEAESLAFQLANAAYEGIIGAGSLDAYAQKNRDLTLKESAYFSKDDGPAELVQDQLFLDKAFELNKGELSSLLKGESGYAILYAVDIQEPEIPSFETVADNLEDDFRESRSRELAKIAADDFFKECSDATGDQDIATRAETKDYAVMDSGLLSQNDSNEETEFPAALIQDAFLLSSSSPLPKTVGEDGDDYYVYAFSKREIAEMKENAEEKAKYKTNLQRFKQQQLLTAWLRNRESSAEITQHKSL